jgi:hypothetical protein
MVTPRRAPTTSFELLDPFPGPNGRWLITRWFDSLPRLCRITTVVLSYQAVLGRRTKSLAEVAELADAHGSGPCTRKGVGVRVPSSAPADSLSIDLDSLEPKREIEIFELPEGIPEIA